MDSTPTEQLLNAIAEMRQEIRANHAESQAEAVGLRTEVTSVRSAVMDRIDRLQSAIEQLRSEMTVNWATADTAIRNARAHQDEVRQVYDLFSAMQRQLRVLSGRVDDLESRGSAAD